MTPHLIHIYIAPKFTAISVGHYNTSSHSPILHPNIHLFQWATMVAHLIHQNCTQICTHFSGPLWYPMWFTYITPKFISISVGNLITLSASPILHPNTHPFGWATTIPHVIHQYCTQIHTHFSGPLKYPLWFTNIAPKYPPILMGHCNTPSCSPILHLNLYSFQRATSTHSLIPQYCTQMCTHFSGPLQYPVWFTNIAPKYPSILVGHYDTPCDSPIILPDLYPFQWATWILFVVQKCYTQIPTHLSGPPQYTIQFTHIAPKFVPISVGHFNTLSDSPILPPNTHLFSGPLRYPMWFINITPKFISISVGHLNTLCGSPILHPNTHPF